MSETNNRIVEELQSGPEPPKEGVCATCGKPEAAYHSYVCADCAVPFSEAVKSPVHRIVKDAYMEGYRHGVEDECERLTKNPYPASRITSDELVEAEDRRLEENLEDWLAEREEKKDEGKTA